MDSFTIELVSNASAQLFPDKRLSSFTNLYRSNCMWKVQGRLQCEKYPTQECYKMSESKSSSFDKKFSESTEFYFMKPGL